MNDISPKMSHGQKFSGSSIVSEDIQVITVQFLHFMGA